MNANLDFSDLKNHLIYSFSKERELLNSLRELHRIFNYERESIEDVYTVQTVAAYAYYFMPTNFPKLEFVLKQLPEPQVQLLREKDWIDLGCGPGSLGLGLYDFIRPECKNYFGIERSAPMRRQGDKILSHYAPQMSVKLEASFTSNLPQDQVLIMGNVVNEMTEDQVLELIEKLNPALILILDIGTKHAFNKLLSLRTRLLSKRFVVNFPCLRQDSCPMKGSEDWCHQKITVAQPQEWERIGQLLKNDRRHLAFTSLVMSRSGEQLESSNGVRVIRWLPENKFSFNFVGCGETGELNKYQILKKSLIKKAQKDFKKTAWGEFIEYKEMIKKGDFIRLSV